MTLLPGWLVAVLLLGLPIGVVLFFGRSALRPIAPELYHCLRCDHDFRDDAWRGYPDRCPRCRSRSWATRAAPP
jgi:hypothetical protein